MQNYSRFGITDFVVLVGFQSNLIREYFSDFWLHQNDVTFNLSSPSVQANTNRQTPWTVTVVETGLESQTAERLLKAKEYLGENFYLTYGDGVGTIDLDELKSAHLNNGTLVTLTAVQPPARFGALTLLDGLVTQFQEKPAGEGSWINGGYFILNQGIFEHINRKNESFEYDVLPRLAKLHKLGYYKHNGFWQPVDTQRDLRRLEEEIRGGKLPWIPETPK